MHILFSRIALGVAIALLLSACKFVLPATISATAATQDSKGTPYTAKLTKDQINALENWFSLHQSDWTSSPASYVPGTQIQARHANGDVTYINILQGIIVVNNSNGQYVLHPSADDLSALRFILHRPSN